MSRKPGRSKAAQPADELLVQKDFDGVPSQQAEVGTSGIVNASQASVWSAHVQKYMYQVARKFGFQTFNRPGPSKKGDDEVQWVPATAFLAADHVIQLLVSDGLPREMLSGDADKETLETAFAKAVWRLHATIFTPYQVWGSHVRVDPFPNSSQAGYWSENLGSIKSTNAGLLDLCLYFGLWTEAANLKHTPELMWFLFFVMRYSENYMQLENRINQDVTPWRLPREELDKLLDMRARRITMRNDYKHIIMTIRQDQFSDCPGNQDKSTRKAIDIFDDSVAGAGVVSAHPVVKNLYNRIFTERKTMGIPPSMSHTEQHAQLECLAEMVALGDGGDFTLRIVQPIFSCLAYEIANKGGTGKEAALRITYDDANESFSHVGNVKKILYDLNASKGALYHNAFHNLWTLGAHPWNEYRVKRYYKGAERDETLVGDPDVKLGWFRKTYQERRTWFALFRAFFRVLAFHTLLFHALLALALTPKKGNDWWLPLSSVTITHAILQGMYGYAGSYLQAKVRPPPAGRKERRLSVKRSTFISVLCCFVPFLLSKTRKPTGWEKGSSDVGKRDNRDWSARHLNAASGLFRRVLYTFGWMLVVLALLFFFIGQFIDEQKAEDSGKPLSASESWSKIASQDIWISIAGIYGGVIVGHWVLTTRDGYVIGHHSLTGGIASMWTGILKCCRCLDSPLSKGFQDQSFVYVNPSVGWVQTITNMFFWLFVLSIKLPFDYFLLIKPLAKPIRALLKQGWLNIGKGEIGGTDIPYPDGDWLLVGALTFPAFIMVMVDTGVFYQVAVFVFGCANGFLHLNLGQITNWNDVIRDFDLGVDKLFEKVISKAGQEHMNHPDVSRAYFDNVVPGARDARVSSTLVDKLSHSGSSLVDQLGPWMAFSSLWDKIVTDMRENDLVNNSELENLKFTKVPLLTKYDKRPVILPCCFYAGKVQNVVDAGDVTNVATLAVLEEMYDLVLVLLRELCFLPEGAIQKLREVRLLSSTGSQYHLDTRKGMVDHLKSFIDALMKFSTMDKPTTEADHKARSEAKSGLANLFAAIAVRFEVECSIYSAQKFMKSSNEHSYIQPILEGFDSKSGDASEAKAVYDQLPPGCSTKLDNLYKGSVAGVFVDDVRTLLQVFKNAMTRTEKEAQPRGAEACRMLRFFMSTMFNPHMKTPTPVHLMMSLTTLVPHYAEDVIYPVDVHEVTKQTGKPGKTAEPTNLIDPAKGYEISTMEFLRNAHEDDWKSFVERVVKKYGVVIDAKSVTEKDFLPGGSFGGPPPRCNETELGYWKEDHPGFVPDDQVDDARMDLMMWASKRGQLLARTTYGMMLYERALRDLMAIEHTDRDMQSQAVQDMLENKFRHIVASQVYGAKKASGKASDRWLAYAVDKLMQKFPSFRVAYVDAVNASAPGAMATQFSVLLRHNKKGGEDGKGAIEEVYRVKLPQQNETKTGIVVGEGKPENQNHAAVFCFGEALQTIDMNQDNNLAESYKMRNLLGEFGVDGPMRIVGNLQDSAHKFRISVTKEQGRQAPVALVGFREWIFSGSAGALGSFAAGSEFAFGTIVQRTMGNPGGARFHYGHPDVWNKLFTMTRGGVSKATRAFHISEDVFGGYNAVFRGAVIKYREYLSVGKGRDVGFEQINGFEAKVAGGNGEQSISRDAYRLASRLDWFRLMSWYHSGIGFFMNTSLLMASVYLSVFVLFVFALSDSLTLEDANGTVLPAFNSIMVVQLGMLSLIPYWGELCMESGLIVGSFEILRQLLAGAVMFFIFRQQTSAHYFTQDVYYGGAKYIATGRGFALTHSSYVRLFSSFGRSHMYFGYQLGLMALSLAFLGIPKYALSTWGVWLVAISLFFSPFWFNPLSFDLRATIADWNGYVNWMSGDVDVGIGKSWASWHRLEMHKPRNVMGLQTDHGWNRLAGVLMQVFNVVMVIACFERLDDPETKLVERLDFTDPDNGVPFDPPSFETVQVLDWERGGRRAKQVGIIIFELFVIALAIAAIVNSSYRGIKSKKVKRLGSVVMSICFFAVFVAYLVYFAGDGAEGFTDFLLLCFANFTCLIIVVQLSLFMFPLNSLSMRLVDTGYYMGDYIVGLVTFGILFALSLLPIVDTIQGTLLYNYDFVKDSQTGQQLRNLIAKSKDTFDPFRRGKDDAEKVPTPVVATRPLNPVGDRPGSDRHSAPERYPGSSRLGGIARMYAGMSATAHNAVSRPVARPVARVDTDLDVAPVLSGIQLSSPGPADIVNSGALDDLYLDPKPDTKPDTKQS